METGVLCYLIAPDPVQTPASVVCLARKRHKVGSGLWNGYGGHCESNEKPLDAAVRETKEESGVCVNLANGVREVACVTYFERPSKVNYRDLGNYDPQWTVHTFLVSRWNGDPVETQEMGPPKWFYFDKIPYKEMLPADRFTLPLILADLSTASFFEADVYYGPGKKEVEWFAVRPFNSVPSH